MVSVGTDLFPSTTQDDRKTLRSNNIANLANDDYEDARARTPTSATRTRGAPLHTRQGDIPVQARRGPSAEAGWTTPALLGEDYTSSRQDVQAAHRLTLPIRPRQVSPRPPVRRTRSSIQLISPSPKQTTKTSLGDKTPKTSKKTKKKSKSVWGYVISSVPISPEEGHWEGLEWKSTRQLRQEPTASASHDQGGEQQVEHAKEKTNQLQRVPSRSSASLRRHETIILPNQTHSFSHLKYPHPEACATPSQPIHTQTPRRSQDVTSSDRIPNSRKRKERPLFLDPDDTDDEDASPQPLPIQRSTTRRSQSRVLVYHVNAKMTHSRQSTPTSTPERKMASQQVPATPSYLRDPFPYMHNGLALDSLSPFHIQEVSDPIYPPNSSPTRSRQSKSRMMMTYDRRRPKRFIQGSSQRVQLDDGIDHYDPRQNRPRTTTLWPVTPQKPQLAGDGTGDDEWADQEDEDGQGRHYVRPTGNGQWSQHDNYGLFRPESPCDSWKAVREELLPVTERNIVFSGQVDGQDDKEHVEHQEGQHRRRRRTHRLPRAMEPILDMTRRDSAQDRLEEYIQVVNGRQTQSRIVYPSSRLPVPMSQLNIRGSAVVGEARCIPPGTLRRIDSIPFEEAATILRERCHRDRLPANSGLLRAGRKEMAHLGLVQTARQKRGATRKGSRQPRPTFPHPPHSGPSEDGIPLTSSTERPRRPAVMVRPPRVPPLRFTADSPPPDIGMLIDQQGNRSGGGLAFESGSSNVQDSTLPKRAEEANSGRPRVIHSVFSRPTLETMTPTDSDSGPSGSTVHTLHRATHSSGSIPAWTPRQFRATTLGSTLVASASTRSPTWNQVQSEPPQSPNNQAQLQAVTLTPPSQAPLTSPKRPSAFSRATASTNDTMAKAMTGVQITNYLLRLVKMPLSPAMSKRKARAAKIAARLQAKKQKVSLGSSEKTAATMGDASRSIAQVAEEEEEEEEEGEPKERADTGSQRISNSQKWTRTGVRPRRLSTSTVRWADEEQSQSALKTPFKQPSRNSQPYARAPGQQQSLRRTPSSGGGARRPSQTAGLSRMTRSLTLSTTPCVEPLPANHRAPVNWRPCESLNGV